MSRGKHFNHKTKGHDHQLPESGKAVEAKTHETVEFAIEPVAAEGDRPVSVKKTKK
ncbi:hypothetical protein [Priestia koreensis]|uniref:hypothetical protein n=1 Tax=Priestia koreensis TaxID=284581 RepID=UPI000AE73DCB|nr:hypothetical protein [Priestia koreensis]MCM3003231.1 hypothetical protein [Priestia koreensis]UNL86032.1 hypothetical protein IE339_05875 [Priestia koreensis]